MKKIMALLFVLLMAFALCACAGKPETDSGKDADLTEAYVSEVDESAEATTKTPASTGSDEIILGDQSFPRDVEEIDLQYTGFTDLSALADFTNLKTLRLGSNGITDISALEGLTELEELYLEFNSIEDISALAGLTKLKTLNIEHNAISDVSPLSGLTELELLYISFNPVTDLSPLAGLTNLAMLYVYEIPAEDYSPVEFVRFLLK